jgi:hypothetical protein
MLPLSKWDVQASGVYRCAELHLGITKPSSIDRKPQAIVARSRSLYAHTASASEKERCQIIEVPE